MVRVAVLESDRCINGDGCNYICGNVCPVNRAGKECITLPEEEIGSSGKEAKIRVPIISEELCIGCNICVLKCPVDCIYIENLVQELKEPPVHRFGENAFRVYRLPNAKKGEVVGIIGRNGIGKSTILKILSGQLSPNLGEYGKNAKAIKSGENQSHGVDNSNVHAKAGYAKAEQNYDQVIEFFRGKELQN